MTNNSQSKSLALMFLLGAFLTGGALGFAADRAIAASKPAAERSGPSSDLARELELTPEQSAAIDSIMRWRASQDREAVKPVKHLMIANRDSARVLMMQKFNPEQQVKFKTMLEEMRLRSEKKKQNQPDSR
jgi:Spy/CpxP family protein refolding chaperone